MSLFGELKRRNVIRMAGLYLVGAWLVTQVASTLLPLFDAPPWVARTVVVLLAIGFTPALVVAWIFELTPSGLKRDAEVTPQESIAPQTAQRMNSMIIAVLILAVLYFGVDKFLLAPRRDATHQAATASQPALPARVISEMSIAVLPLANEGGDKDEQYFSDGLSEDLITALSQFAGLKVISRNSAFQFRDSPDGARTIGEKLGVAHLLEGSVRRLGETVRIHAALVLAADGSTVWSERYDRPYVDLFKLQDEITAAVANALKAKLIDPTHAGGQADRPPSGNLDAYNAWLEGTFRSRTGVPADMHKAIENFETAIRLDPAYATAYASLSTTWTNLAQSTLAGDEKKQAYIRGEAAAQSALSADPNLAAAHVARGLFLHSSLQDWSGAEAEYRRALALAPGDAFARFQLALLLAGRGQVQQAIDVTRQLLANDPRRASGHTFLGKYLVALGRLDEAEQSFHKALDLRPGNATPYVGLSTVAILRNDAVGSLHWMQQAPEGNWRTIGVALATQIGTDRVAADANLASLIEQQGDDSAVQIAQVYALRKDPDKMFEWLDRAWAAHDSGIGLVMYDPFLQRYKDDPRFAAFLRKVGLVPATQGAE